ARRDHLGQGGRGAGARESRRARGRARRLRRRLGRSPRRRPTAGAVDDQASPDQLVRDEHGRGAGGRGHGAVGERGHRGHAGGAPRVPGEARAEVQGPLSGAGARTARSSCPGRLAERPGPVIPWGPMRVLVLSTRLTDRRRAAFQALVQDRAELRFVASAELSAALAESDAIVVDGRQPAQPTRALAALRAAVERGVPLVAIGAAPADREGFWAHLLGVTANLEPPPGEYFAVVTP